ncbi:hypothetical protein [Spirochaeta dissipatitropha]
MDTLKRSYNAVIGHCIDQAGKLAEQAQGNGQFGAKPIAGFCPLHGPTGSGKSSSLYRQGHLDGSVPALEHLHEAGYQAIFVTHRWNILQDVYRNIAQQQDSRGQPFRVSVVYGKTENSIAAATGKSLPHENADYAVPQADASIEFLVQRKLLGKESQKTGKILMNLAQKITGLHKHVEQGEHTKQFDAEIIQKARQSLERACSAFEQTILNVIREHQTHITDLLKNYGSESQHVKVARDRLAELRGHPWIRRILPGIAWHDENQHVLIMTTQKLYYSFYDGNKKVRLNSSGLAGRIIFIDEFDYQAGVIQSLLAENQLIQSPPHFLYQLLHEGKNYLNRLPSTKTDLDGRIQELLSKVIGELEKDLSERQIELSGPKALIVSDDGPDTEPLFEKSYLFRSDHLITSNRLVLQPGPKGYEVKQTSSDQGQGDSLFLDEFLRTIEKHIRHFVFEVLSISGDGDFTELLWKLCHILFSPANDYRNSYYTEVVTRSIPGVISERVHAELVPLIKSNRLPNTQASFFGLTSWLLEQNQAAKDIDPLRLDIRRAYLPTTPEGLLFSLASRNLVFGLSATSYIERSIGNIDLRWVEAALRHLAESRNPDVRKSSLGIPFNERDSKWFKRPIPYVQNRQDMIAQRDVIAEINEKKKEIRQTRLRTLVQTFTEFYESEEGKRALDSVTGILGNEKTYHKVIEYRKELLAKLLYVISEVGKSGSRHLGHLVFVNSIKYLDKWLKEKKAEESRAKVQWLQDDSGFADQLSASSPLLKLVDVFIPKLVHGEKVLLCLLTAENQKRSGFHLAYQEAFATGRIVIVLTQTATATNGINLDFSLPDRLQTMDLGCLYILEAQHFYFSAEQYSDDYTSGDSGMAQVGTQLRDLEKLVRVGEFSHREQKKFIMSLMAQEKEGCRLLNARYKISTDYIKNTAANVQQQVGRVERAWAKIPEIEIHVETTVAKTLVQFAGLPNYINFRNQVSHLNKQLLEDLENLFSNAERDFLMGMLVPCQDGKDAKRIIDDILVPAIRESRHEAAGNTGIEELWRSLGRAVLCLDYAWTFGENKLGLIKQQRLMEWACLERPSVDQEGGALWYDPDTWQFFSEAGEGLRLYNPDYLYRPINECPHIYDWFNKRGFRVSLRPPANELEERYIYHPHVSQRLLQGRLGEEAIRGLLYAHAIRTTDWLADKRALELYDFSIRNSLFRVDAKYWHETTIEEADRKYKLWLDGGCADGSDPLRLAEQLSRLRSIEGDAVKLVIINLTSITSRVSLKAFDCKVRLLPDAFRDQADILVLGGCIVEGSWELTEAFMSLVKLLIDAQMTEEEGND